MKGTFFIKRHQHKAEPFVTALNKAGYVDWPFRNWPDFYIFDHEHGDYGYGFSYQMSVLKEKNLPVFLYPHSARAGYPYTLREPWPDIACRFVFSEGAKEIYRRVGVHGHVEVVGWPWSDIRPFVEPDIDEKLKVLFCPIHPNENGFLHKLDRHVNEYTLKALARIKKTTDVTVRYLQALEHQGLWVEEGVEYIKGDPDGSLKQVQQADIVIGAYTLAYMSIAIGKPTIMIGEHERLHSGNAKKLTRFSDSEDLWKEYSRYPYNFEDVFYDADQVYKMFGQVVRYTDDVDTWSRLFIGDPFQPEKFVKTIEAFLTKTRTPTKQFLADATEITKIPGSVVEPHFVPKED